MARLLTTATGMALAAARAGAAVVRAAYGGFSRRSGSGSGLTTGTDLGAKRAILDVIGTDGPGHRLVGEKSGRAGGPTRDSGSSIRCAEPETPPPGSPHSR